MDLEQVLGVAVKRIHSGLLSNEAQVKQAVIVPILRALGWDDTNPAEFVPEHSLDLENGWWLGTNLSTPQVRKNIELTCQTAGVQFGSQLTLIER